MVFLITCSTGAAFKSQHKLFFGKKILRKRRLSDRLRSDGWHHRRVNKANMLQSSGEKFCNGCGKSDKREYTVHVKLHGNHRLGQCDSFHCNRCVYYVQVEMELSIPNTLVARTVGSPPSWRQQDNCLQSLWLPQAWQLRSKTGTSINTSLINGHCSPLRCLWVAAVVSVEPYAGSRETTRTYVGVLHLYLISVHIWHLVPFAAGVKTVMMLPSRAI